ncbi:unnamed protein product, partial [Prorocentrum cordatum]
EIVGKVKRESGTQRPGQASGDNREVRQRNGTIGWKIEQGVSDVGGIGLRTRQGHLVKNQDYYVVSLRSAPQASGAAQFRGGGWGGLGVMAGVWDAEKDEASSEQSEPSSGTMSARSTGLSADERDHPAEARVGRGLLRDCDARATSSKDRRTAVSPFRSLPDLHPHEVELRVAVTDLSREVAPEKFRSKTKSVGGFVFGLLVFPQGTKSAPEHARKNRPARDGDKDKNKDKDKDKDRDRDRDRDDEKGKDSERDVDTLDDKQEDDKAGVVAVASKGKKETRWISAFVEARPFEDYPPHWYFEDVQFLVSLINFQDLKKSIVKHDKHTFSPVESSDGKAIDRGWHDFVHCDEATLRNNGFVDPKDGTVCFRASVYLAGGAMKVSPKTKSRYMSLSKIELSGPYEKVPNFLSSLVQLWYHIGHFRGAVYGASSAIGASSAAGSGSKKTSNVLGALREVFVRLQARSPPASCSALCSSFGRRTWSRICEAEPDAFCREVFRAVEAELVGPADGRGDEAKGPAGKKDAKKDMPKAKSVARADSASQDSRALWESVRDLFEFEVEWAAQAVEGGEFGDSSAFQGPVFTLVVRGFSSLEATLDHYFTPKIIEDGSGVRVRTMRKIRRLPHVLQWHLKRGDYDCCTGLCGLSDTYLGFPRQIDMAKYCEGAGVYNLYGVMVESDEHYWSYIRPEMEGDQGQWYRFDDRDNVTCAMSNATAIDASFGGEEWLCVNYLYGPSGVLTRPKGSRACLLVYLREASMDFLLHEPRLPKMAREYQAATAHREREPPTKAAESEAAAAAAQALIEEVEAQAMKEEKKRKQKQKKKQKDIEGGQEGWTCSGSWGQPGINLPQRRQSCAHQPGAAAEGEEKTPKGKMDELKHRQLGRDSTVMSDYWEVAHILEMQTEHRAEAPEYIRMSAAFKVDEDASLAIGDQCANIMGTIERFYCMAYQIEPGDRRAFTGGGQCYKLEETDSTEKGERSTIFKDMRADWWARVETTLSRRAKLRTRGRGLRQQEEMARAGRQLAYTMPPLKGSPSATAQLHHTIWQHRLRKLEEIDNDVIQGMAAQAEEERQAGTRRDYRESTRSFCQWLADTEAKPGVLHRITKPPLQREEEIATENHTTDSPLEIVDAKMRDFTKVWQDDGIPHSKHTELLKALREQARNTEEPFWTLENLDMALKGGARPRARWRAAETRFRQVGSKPMKLKIGRCPDIRAQARRAWPKVYFRLPNTEVKKRWQQREPHDIHEKTAGLAERARDEAGANPIFWLRGLKPSTWTSPPTCSAEEGLEVNLGLATGRAQPDLQAEGGKELTACGDGSGGEYSNDDGHRRCGRSWTILDTEGKLKGFELKAGQSGALPGARQTNNRADLFALIKCMEETRGPITFWTDSEGTFLDWNAERDTKKELTCPSADLWCCNEAIRQSTNSLETVKTWLQEGCKGPLPETGRGVVYDGIQAHEAHELRWLERERRWYCRRYASSVTEYVSDRLQQECEGSPSCNSMKYRLKAWETLADLDHWRREDAVPPDLGQPGHKPNQPGLSNKEPSDDQNDTGLGQLGNSEETMDAETPERGERTREARGGGGRGQPGPAAVPA